MLIGIMGKARSGKDTFAFMLAEELFKLTKQRYVLIAFAHALKLRVQKEFDLSYEQLWGEEKEVEDTRYNKQFKYCDKIKLNENGSSNTFWSPREILQSYGEFYRSIDYNFWIDRLFEVVENRQYENIIVTDVRYANEMDSIIKRKGVLIKIVRDIGKKSIHGQDHISETGLDDYNNVEAIIENNGTMEEFKVAANDVAKILVKKK